MLVLQDEHGIWMSWGEDIFPLAKPIFCLKTLHAQKRIFNSVRDQHHACRRPQKVDATWSNVIFCGQAKFSVVLLVSDPSSKFEIPEKRQVSWKKQVSKLRPSSDQNLLCINLMGKILLPRHQVAEGLYITARILKSISGWANIIFWSLIYSSQWHGGRCLQQ